MYNGLLNIYKEKDFTSHDVVAKLRGILRQKKIGHTGTLDPNAEGVLPVCLGKGTKLCDMLTGTKKQYKVSFVFEKETDTEDIWGTVTKTHENKMHRSKIRSCLSLENMIRYHLCILQRKLMERSCMNLPEKEKLSSANQNGSGSMIFQILKSLIQKLQ